MRLMDCKDIAKILDFLYLCMFIPYCAVMVTVEFSNDIIRLAELLKGYPAVFVVADKRIKRYVTEPLVEVCAEKGVALRGVFDIAVSERRKNFRSVEKIVRWLIDAGADRDALILAVGGGITSDLAGFAACVYKRGVRYAVVPTTLLAQVDASVGGKTGCNVEGYKNMAGIIRQPEFTFINTDYLRTLPWEEYLSGYAELLKTFIIGDAEMYREAVSSTDPNDLERFVRRAVEIKAEIVSRDEQDMGERHLLNLGHTFAHAIESLSTGCRLRRAVTGEKSCCGLNFRPVPHGLAVAMGIIMAAKMSEKQGVATQGREGDGAGAPSLVDTLTADFSTIGLPVECPYSEDELADAIRRDKKAVSGGLDYVLICRIGKCKIVRLPF